MPNRLGERVENKAVLREEIAAWKPDRNIRSKWIRWQFKTGDARIRRRGLYPQFPMC